MYTCKYIHICIFIYIFSYIYIHSPILLNTHNTYTRPHTRTHTENLHKRSSALQNFRVYTHLRSHAHTLSLCLFLSFVLCLSHFSPFFLFFVSHSHTDTTPRTCRAALSKLQSSHACSLSDLLPLSLFFSFSGALARACACVRTVSLFQATSLSFRHCLSLSGTIHINNTHQQHTSTIHINNTHQQYTSTTHINNTHQQHTSTTHINNTHQQHTSTTHINSTHQQYTSTTHINNTHQQHTSTTHINNTHQQHSSTSDEYYGAPSLF